MSFPLSLLDVSFSHHLLLWCCLQHGKQQPRETSMTLWVRKIKRSGHLRISLQSLRLPWRSEEILWWRSLIQRRPTSTRWMWSRRCLSRHYLVNRTARPPSWPRLKCRLFSSTGKIFMVRAIDFSELWKFVKRWAPNQTWTLATFFVSTYVGWWASNLDLIFKPAKLRFFPTNVLNLQLPHLKCYVRFCSSQSNSAFLLQKLIEVKPKFGEILHQCQQDPRVQGMPLPFYLLKPVKRITEYPILLEKLLKNTSGDHPDHDNLEKAISIARGLCNAVCPVQSLPSEGIINPSRLS